MSHLAGLNKWYRVHALKDGDMLVGYRFQYPTSYEDAPELDGTRTLYVDTPPVAGPIWWVSTIRSVAGTRTHYWHYAKCSGCTAISKHYKKRHYGIVLWAQKHTCKVRVDRLTRP